jgi:hypothetical protein
MVFKLIGNIFFVILCTSIPNSYGQEQNELLEMQEPLAARKRFISNVEFLVGSGIVFVRGDEFYRENDVLKPGFSVNIGLVHKVSSRVQLNSILAYESRGSKSIYYDDYDPSAISTLISNLTLHYATVTFFVAYSFPESQKLFCGFGPYFGFLYRAKIATEHYINGSLVVMSAARPDPYIDYKWYDTGLALTTGIHIRSKRKPRASLQLMYKKGIMDINQPIITQMRNNNVSIHIGITLK